MDLDRAAGRLRAGGRRVTARPRARRAASAALGVVLTLAGAGCAARTTSTPGLAVTATIYPLAEFARRSGGAPVNVHTLIPPGVEAHDYEPTLKDLAALARARRFIYNGAGWEPWVERRLPQLAEGTLRVNATEDLPLVRGDGGVDPHVWLDPVLAQQQVERIFAALGRADPAGRSRYEANAAALRAALQALDADYPQVLH